MLGVLRHFFGLWKTFLEVPEKEVMKETSEVFFGMEVVDGFLKRCSSNWFVGLVQMVGEIKKNHLVISW